MGVLAGAAEAKAAADARMAAKTAAERRELDIYGWVLLRNPDYLRKMAGWKTRVASLLTFSLCAVACAGLPYIHNHQLTTPELRRCPFFHLSKGDLRVRYLPQFSSPQLRGVGREDS